MNREILVSAVLRAESRREGAIDIDIVRRALAAQPAPVPKLIRTFNAGYMLGHHDTVEGVFTDIHSSDMDTYHADEVAEFFGQSAAPAAKCDGGTCGAGGYCANCPKQAAAPVPVPLTGYVYLVKYGTQCLEAFADLSAAAAYAYNIGSHAYVACVTVRTPEYVTHVFGIAASPEKKP
jgi:hypothetical protein